MANAALWIEFADLLVCQFHYLGEAGTDRGGGQALPRKNGFCGPGAPSRISGGEGQRRGVPPAGGDTEGPDRRPALPRPGPAPSILAPPWGDGRGQAAHLSLSFPASGWNLRRSRQVSMAKRAVA